MGSLEKISWVLYSIQDDNNQGSMRRWWLRVSSWVCDMGILRLASLFLFGDALTRRNTNISCFSFNALGLDKYGPIKNLNPGLDPNQFFARETFTVPYTKGV